MKSFLVELVVELEIAHDASWIAFLLEAKDGLETDPDFLENMATNTGPTFLELVEQRMVVKH